MTRRGDPRWESELAPDALEALPDAVLVCDDALRIRFANRAVQTGFGWSMAELEGQRIDMCLIDPGERTDLGTSGLAAEPAGAIETVGLRKDGSRFAMRIEWREIAGIEPRSFVAVLREVPAAATAPGALAGASEQARAQLAALFEHTPVAISVVDTEQKIVLVNKVTADLYGQSPDLFVGMDISDLAGFWPEFDKVVQAGLEVISSGVPQFASAVWNPPDGADPVVYDIVCFPIRDHTGAVIQVGLFMLDGTAQRRTETVLAEREAQLSGLFEHVPVAISVIAEDLSIVMVNKRVAEAYGQPAGYFVGRHVTELARNWSDFDAIIETGSQVLKDGKSRYLTTQALPLADGSIPIFSVLFFPMRTDQGKVTQIGVFMSNVSAQKQAETALAVREAMLSSLFEHVSVRIAIITADQKIVMVNRRVSEESGLPAEFFVGKDVALLRGHWSNFDEIVAAGIEVTKDGARRELISQWNHPDEQKAGVFNVQLFPIAGAEGQVDQVGVFMMDLTEQHRSQHELAISREALHQSEKLAALGQMLAGVAHELNNPLATVVLRSAMLEEKLAGTPHVAALQKLSEAADRCARIVKTFLAMARQTGPQRQVAQLNTLVEAAIAMTDYWLASSDVALVREFGQAMPDLEVDEDQIVQLVSNLVVNAQHALMARQDGRRIAIRTGLEHGRAYIEVADNGPGIAPDIAARVFDPFFTTKDVGHGTGLGLSVCRNVALAHGGDLILRETPGGGATFRLTLPLGTGQMLADAEVPAAVDRVHAKGRLLVVDDEPDVAQSLAECLEPLGLDVVTAANGRAALAQIEAGRFDAVISDVTMPVMGGIALLEHLRDHAPQLAASFALMTGDVFHPDLKPIRDGDICPIIEKPFNPLAIREVAARLVQSGSEP